MSNMNTLAREKPCIALWMFELCQCAMCQVSEPILYSEMSQNENSHERSLDRIDGWGWERGPVGELCASKVGGPEFQSQHPIKDASIHALALAREDGFVFSPTTW